MSRVDVVCAFICQAPPSSRPIPKRGEWEGQKEGGVGMTIEQPGRGFHCKSRSVCSMNPDLSKHGFKFFEYFMIKPTLQQ